MLEVVISWCLLLGCCLGSDVTLWGVQPNEVHLYDPKKDFNCKDGSLTVDFAKVNDDYCDCPDGSDEPSTSACANGVFYCANKGHVGLAVPSSRVNDGTCDCCDGSDEHASVSKCVNNCEELAEIARAEEEERMQHFADDEAEEFRANLVHTGSREQLEKLEKFKKLELAKAEQEETTKELEEKTKKAEAIANAALDAFRGVSKEDKVEEPLSDFEEKCVVETFNSIDLDGNGVLDLFEVKSERIFDLNKNNRVEDREMKWYFDAMPGIANLEIFRKKMWKKIGRLYVLEKEMEKSFAVEFDWDKKGEDEEARKEHEREQRAKRKKAREDAAKIKAEREKLERDAEGINEEDVNYDENAGEYDEQTRESLLTAINARHELFKAQEKLRDLTKQKERAEKFLYEPDVEESDLDDEVTEHLDEFGPNERSKYFPGRMHCYKLTDNEFQYKLCPFWGASQIPKQQKHGVSLGRWVGWGKEKGEVIMVYKNGDSCEDGILRSTKVRIFCGSRSMLVHVEEPRPCQYRMDFKSPAGCHIKHLKEANVTITSHDEL